jgi:hypothetical protein
VQADKYAEQACCHRPLAFEGMGETYDTQIGWDELVMGIKVLRWWLVSQAKGQV